MCIKKELLEVLQTTSSIKFLGLVGASLVQNVSGEIGFQINNNMIIEEKIFIKFANTHAENGTGLGPCEKTTVSWCIKNGLPIELQHLFSSNIPKVDIYAGAGAIFSESELIRWNDSFPEALQSRLLIIGSAANGDHIAIDLEDGSTGYISHEHDWKRQPRDYFIAVSKSIGFYLRDINQNPPLVPEDYWEAKG